MTYEELKKIAQPHIRENDNIPSSSFLLLCQLHIPFKDAEEYWQEIKESAPKRKIPIKQKVFVASIIAFLILCSSAVGFLSAKIFFKQKQTSTTAPIPTIHTPTPIENTNQNKDVVVTISGTKYHMPDCRYVKNKTNIIEEDIHTAINDGYEPCKVCIK